MNNTVRLSQEALYGKLYGYETNIEANLDVGLH
jgi:hypothetical protein